MKLLLDTCCLIWLHSDPSQLSARAAALLNDPANERLLSVVSLWEVTIKVGTGKLVLGADLEQIVATQVAQNGLEVLPLIAGHTYAGRSLPWVHKDPFDRLLICQATVEGATILTPDHLIRQYTIPTEW